MPPDTVAVPVTVAVPAEQLDELQRYTVTLPSPFVPVPFTLTLLDPLPPKDVIVTDGAAVSIVIARAVEAADVRPPFDALAVRLWTPSANDDVETEYVPREAVALPTAVTPS